MLNSFIPQVRRFNRLVTQRVGALDESYLRRGRPLAEARLLFEIGGDGADLRALRYRLGLDSGYLSRLLRSLEAQGLLEVKNQSGDGRLRRARLTRKGRSEVAAYDRLSDELAASFLAPLDAKEGERLVSAMAEVEHLLQASAVQVCLEPPTRADGRWCLDQYYRELAERFESGFDPHGDPIQDEEMTPPAGFFFIARLQGDPVGCGALKRTGKTMGEIKRVWTAPFARGRGIARKMLKTLEGQARECGLKTLRLDTNQTLKEAQAFYRAEGYREIGRFNDNPYAHHWFQKHL
jgi:DNA-binding MarR family transcriptional regulator/predicted GNAT family acetyltransferase